VLEGIVLANGATEDLISTHSGHIVEMEMGFFDTLSVVTLRVGETEETLLEVVTARLSVWVTRA